MAESFLTFKIKSALIPNDLTFFFWDVLQEHLKETSEEEKSKSLKMSINK